LLRVLNCAGFTYREIGDSLAIVPLDPPQTGAVACGAGMKIEN